MGARHCEAMLVPTPPVRLSAGRLVVFLADSLWLEDYPTRRVCALPGRQALAILCSWRPGRLLSQVPSPPCAAAHASIVRFAGPLPRVSFFQPHLGDQTPLSLRARCTAERDPIWAVLEPARPCPLSSQDQVKTPPRLEIHSQMNELGGGDEVSRGRAAGAGPPGRCVGTRAARRETTRRCAPATLRPAAGWCRRR